MPPFAIRPATYLTPRPQCCGGKQGVTDEEQDRVLSRRVSGLCGCRTERRRRTGPPALRPSEIVHLGERRNRVAEAEGAGVKSVPALVLDGQPYHINFGAPLSALK